MARNMETQARSIFRNALFQHYIDGIAAGDDVEQWLKTHGGWFPDEQSDYGYGIVMPPSDGPDVMSKDPALAMKDAKTLMDRLSKTLGKEENADVLQEVCEWLEHFHQSSERDRSRSPIRVEPLPNTARAALDVVCTRDKEARIDDQRATIARLRQELLAKDAEIGRLQHGIGVKMGPVWVHHGIINPRMTPNQERRESQETLHSFLARLNSELAALHNTAFRVGMNFPMDGEATDNDDEEEEE